MTNERNTGGPPRNGRFRPGTSGNPKGRPKGSRNFHIELDEMMTASIAVREDGKRKLVTRQRALLLTLYDKAIHGDAKSAESLLKLVTAITPKRLPEVEPTEKVAKSDEEIIEEFFARKQQATNGDDNV